MSTNNNSPENPNNPLINEISPELRKVNPPFNKSTNIPSQNINQSPQPLKPKPNLAEEKIINNKVIAQSVLEPAPNANVQASQPTIPQISQLLQNLSNQQPTKPKTPQDQTNLDLKTAAQQIMDSSLKNKDKLVINPTLPAANKLNNVAPLINKPAEPNLKKAPSENPFGETSKNKEKKSSNAKLFYILIFVAILLIPLPKQVGGDIEVSGAPSIDQAMLRPSAPGTLEKFLVKTGDKVFPGQTVAILKSWEIEEKVLEGEKQLARLKSNSLQLEGQLTIAGAELEKSRQEFKIQKAQSVYIQKMAKGLQSKQEPSRIEATKKQLEQIKLQAESLTQKAELHKNLAEKGVYPKQSALQTAYEAASAAKQVESLSAQLKAEEEELIQKSAEDIPRLDGALSVINTGTKRYMAAQTDLMANNLQIAEGQKQLNSYKKQAESLVLKSPIEGVVLTLQTDLLVGQNFNRGDTVVVIGNLNKVKVGIHLAEEEANNVEVGQKVTARIRAVQDTVFTGEVESIAPVNSETGEQVNKRKIRDISMVLENVDGKGRNALRPGMTGYAKIHTGQWKSLLVLTWDEIYKAFRLDRYMDHNIFGSIFSKKSS